jgi:hypothetical protein
MNVQQLFDYLLKVATFESVRELSQPPSKSLNTHRTFEIMYYDIWCLVYCVKICCGMLACGDSSTECRHTV